MNRAEKTIDLHQNGGLNCAQAIITVFGEQFGVTPEAARMLGRPWGGGMAQQAKTCGYLTGALLVLARAFDDGDEARSRKQTGAAVRELLARFQERRGCTACKDLLGADMSTEAGAQLIAEEKRIPSTCWNPGGVGQDVAEILEDLLAPGKGTASTPSPAFW